MKFGRKLPLFLGAVSVCNLSIIVAQDAPRNGASEPSAEKGSLAEVRQLVSAANSTFAEASDSLRSAGKPVAEQTKVLDAVAREVQGALKEVSPNGGGRYDEVQKRIQDTDAKIQAWREKSQDTNISVEMRQRYNGLAQKLASSRENLLKTQLLMDGQRVELQKRLQSVNENREYFAELVSAMDLEEADERIREGLQRLGRAAEKFQELLGRIAEAVGSERPH